MTLEACIIDQPTGTVPHPNNDRNRDILTQRVEARAQRTAPQVGDFVIYPDEPKRGSTYRGTVFTAQVERISYDWEDTMQTSPDGSFHLDSSGHGSFSGALNPGIPTAQLVDTGEVRPGRFWFFDGNWPRAHAGVDCWVPCRVWKYVPA